MKKEDGENSTGLALGKSMVSIEDEKYKDERVNVNFNSNVRLFNSSHADHTLMDSKHELEHQNTDLATLDPFLRLNLDSITAQKNKEILKQKVEARQDKEWALRMADQRLFDYQFRDLVVYHHKKSGKKFVQINGLQNALKIQAVDASTNDQQAQEPVVVPRVMGPRQQRPQTRGGALQGSKSQQLVHGVHQKESTPGETKHFLQQASNKKQSPGPRAYSSSQNFAGSRAKGDRGVPA